jgi:DNA replication and repair protein RecF
MILTDLQIHQVRNLENLRLSLHPRFTFIIGDNGRGKTAILEAIYLLARGQSFRSHEIGPIITHGEKKLTVFARAQDNSTISIQKSSGLPTLVKLNDQLCSSSSQLAYALPCQLFYQNLFEVMDAGSSIRRNLLDWGLFHVKHNYLDLWKSYKRLLLQRNALLKQQAPKNLLLPWDRQLSEVADKIDSERESYFTLWQPVFHRVLSELTDIDCYIEYYKGWDKKNCRKNLQTILNDNYLSDLQRQYTQQGAHQADIIIKTESYSAKKILSRGQQKIILIALKLSQAELLQTDCLYLLDDYAAELDLNHQKRLLSHLASRKGQYILTTMNPQNFDNVFVKENYTVINV